jgi:hypothetical protein
VEQRLASTGQSPTFSREFVALNVRFAAHVERRKRLPLDEALLHFTHLYWSFGLGQDFTHTHSVWQAYVAGLKPRRDLVDWTYTFYRAQQANLAPTVAAPEPVFGCFSYELWPGNRVRIPFRNGETADHSPLSQARRPQRLAELAAMFRHLKSQVPAAATVVGGSWLYNIAAYRRLFPGAFLATAQVCDGEYPFLSQWGQFLDRHGRIKPSIMHTFLDRLAQHDTADRLQHCFPYPVLRLEAPISLFYAFYGIAGGDHEHDA